jgi:hypothetical protein
MGADAALGGERQVVNSRLRAVTDFAPAERMLTWRPPREVVGAVMLALAAACFTGLAWRSDPGILAVGGSALALEGATKVIRGLRQRGPVDIDKALTAGAATLRQSRLEQIAGLAFLVTITAAGAFMLEHGHRFLGAICVLPGMMIPMSLASVIQPPRLVIDPDGFTEVFPTRRAFTPWSKVGQVWQSDDPREDVAYWGERNETGARAGRRSVDGFGAISSSALAELLNAARRRWGEKGGKGGQALFSSTDRAREDGRS